ERCRIGVTDDEDASIHVAPTSALHAPPQRGASDPTAGCFVGGEQPAHACLPGSIERWWLRSGRFRRESRPRALIRVWGKPRSFVRSFVRGAGGNRTRRSMNFHGP